MSPLGENPVACDDDRLTLWQAVCRRPRLSARRRLWAWGKRQDGDRSCGLGAGHGVDIGDQFACTRLVDGQEFRAMHNLGAIEHALYVLLHEIDAVGLSIDRDLALI